MKLLTDYFSTKRILGIIAGSIFAFLGMKYSRNITWATSAWQTLLGMSLLTILGIVTEYFSQKK